MMMHYLLVSDLVSEQEFEDLLETKAAEHAGILDEVTVAMMVVGDLGRAHIKIAEINKAVTKIVSFYGKVLVIDGPREFTREGEEEPGAVATLTLGDPTGTTKMTLWDEKAKAVLELKEGDVVEVIAQPHPGKKDVGFVAMRESNVEIVETKKPPKSEQMAEPLKVRILSMSQVRDIERKDGSATSMQTMLVGDASGTARLITWAPETFADVDVGASVAISGVTRNEDDGVIEYSASEAAEITFVPAIDVLTIDADEVEEGPTPVVTGTVVSTLPVKTFINRRGNESKVRNLRIRGKSGRIVAVALWNAAADTAVIEGDAVEIINAEARPGKFTEIELSVGFGSTMRVIQEQEEAIECIGMVHSRSIGTTLENTDGVWMLAGSNLPEPGTAVTVCGTSSRGRINVDSWMPVPFSVDTLKQRAGRQ